MWLTTTDFSCNVTASLRPPFLHPAFSHLTLPTTQTSASSILASIAGLALQPVPSLLGESLKRSQLLPWNLTDTISHVCTPPLNMFSTFSAAFIANLKQQLERGCGTKDGLKCLGISTIVIYLVWPSRQSTKGGNGSNKVFLPLATHHVTVQWPSWCSFAIILSAAFSQKCLRASIHHKSVLFLAEWHTSCWERVCRI